VDEIVEPSVVITITVVRVVGGIEVIELSDDVSGSLGVSSVDVSEEEDGGSDFVADGVVVRGGSSEVSDDEGGLEVTLGGVVVRAGVVIEGVVVRAVVDGGDDRVVVEVSSSSLVFCLARMPTTFPIQLACAMATKRTQNVRMLTSGRANILTGERNLTMGLYFSQ